MALPQLLPPLSLTHKAAQRSHGRKRLLSDSLAQNYKPAADRLNPTHTEIFYGLLTFSNTVELVVNMEKEKFHLQKFNFWLFWKKQKEDLAVLAPRHGKAIIN